MGNAQQFQIAAFYHFAPIAPENLASLSAELEQLGQSSGLRGLAIIASEGINGTISGRTREELSEYLQALSKRLGFPEFTPKWSESYAWPFRKFKFRIRNEIVTLGKPEVQPLPPHSTKHLSPEEWQKTMHEENVVVLDTRNWYETRIGKFTNAVDPGIAEFQEFSEYLDRSEIEKDKKILIYCTGGIRCEKAIVDMNQKGFANVYQLDGGILNYLKHFPNEKFEGECFVFDNRVAVDQSLQPTQTYRACPHCGQPAEQKITCARCESTAVVCVTCASNGASAPTCSKNCAHHYRLAPEKKGRPQRPGSRKNYGLRPTAATTGKRSL